ncbi:hypothetical protein [Azoarcus olearius]|uniref:Hypothetical membrane protein n=1 Tax=Azoarcus sp. (strain BH72) TaxID=418699 RepID=A1K6E0_AZOSB|nr:hypothetical protein [Azoarcus olearius]CAL94395.1 hypothetical membrane protein [Azoarcus olearius]
MTVTQWLEVLSIGFVAGAVGQLVRAISGLAKLKREQLEGAAGDNEFQLSTMVLSVIIGGTAGALAAIALSDTLVSGGVPSQTILGLLGAGYVGADFISGFAGKHFAVAPTTPEVPQIRGDGKAEPTPGDRQQVAPAAPAPDAVG